MDGEAEKRFIGLLREKAGGQAREGPKISQAREGPKIDMPNLEIEKQLIPLRLKKLENEHQTNIEQYLKKIQELKDKRDKLKKATDILMELNLSAPEEYAQKMDSYPGEIEKLGIEIERERMYLNYLQTKILPLVN